MLARKEIVTDICSINFDLIQQVATRRFIIDTANKIPKFYPNVSVPVTRGYHLVTN